jgi:hypothetical protein
MSNICNNISQTLRPIAQTCGWNPQTGFSRNAQRVMYITAGVATAVIAGIVGAKLYQTGALHAGANRLSSLASTISQKYNTFSFTKTAPSAAVNSSITSLPVTTSSESSSAPDAPSSGEPAEAPVAAQRAPDVEGISGAVSELATAVALEQPLS